MSHRSTAFLLTIGCLGTALSGCSTGDDVLPTTPAPSGDSCAPYPRPTIDTGRTEPSGDNAFARVLGLICDHTGSTARERFRVPGTSDHAKGVQYLVDTLNGLGWKTTKQSFTGADYEAIMQQSQDSGYYTYYSGCSNADRERMRGLTFTNVEGRAGTEGGPIILLMAHFDSKRFASQDPDERNRTKPVLGANDGASGVGVLLELARTRATFARPFELRLFFTDGEDGFEDCHPLAGTTYYADQVNKKPADKARMRAIILLDMVGDADATFYRGCGRDTALADRIWTKARDQEIRQFRNESGCGGLDDHAPFEYRGMKAVDVLDYGPNRPFPPYWHTLRDTPDQLSPDLLGRMTRLVQAVIDELPVA